MSFNDAYWFATAQQRAEHKLAVSLYIWYGYNILSMLATAHVRVARWLA